MNHLTRRIDLILIFGVLGMVAFMVSMIWAAIYLPLPRDMHLPPPADIPHKGEMKWSRSK